jgi:hypothetical protein
MTEESPQQDGLAEWLGETGRADLGYSDVLELLTPDAATRRDYLSKHFETAVPGAAHERLAELAARGLVTVFITTNFDRLLEHALAARGIEPVVVSSDASLKAAPRREHSRCYILKPHGDYLQETIRNTPAEVAELEPGIDAELREVLDRYGVVVLGYSGGDEAIARAIRARDSRYGLYWLARGELPEPARSITEEVGGRVIVRPGAAELLADLDRRLEVFEAQPSGLTPVTVNDEVISLLRRSDTVGLSELLRGERLEFAERLVGLIQQRRLEQPTDDIARECHRALLPVLERRLASLLPLVLHAPELFADEVRSLAETKNRLPASSGRTFWPELLDWCLWWLVYSVGAFAARVRRFAVVAPLFTMQVHSRFGGVVPLADSMPGTAGEAMAKAVMAAQSSQQWLSAAWQSLQADLAGLTLLRERYPQLVSSEDEPLRSLVEFELVMSAALTTHNRNALGRWTEYEGAANSFARELHSDAQLRASVAEAIGLSLEEFDAQAPAALRNVNPFGGFADFGAVNILETGSRQ